MAVCASIVGLVRLPLIFELLVPDNPPVTPPVTVGADHEYKVPTGTIPLTPSVGVIEKVMPLQALKRISVTIGLGVRFTVTVNGVPVQFPETGVTI